MAQFIGKWKGDPSGMTNYDAFCKASEIPEDMIEQFRNATNYLEIKKEGDTWVIDYTSDVSPSRTFKFESGKEVETTDPIEGKTKFTATFESDTRMTEVESSEMMGWEVMKVVREVKGNQMIAEHVLPCGIKMTGVMTKC